MDKLRTLASIAANALVAVALTACGGANNREYGDNDGNDELSVAEKMQLEELENEIEKVNDRLPVETPDGLTLTSMHIVDGYLVITCTYPAESGFEINGSAENKAAIINAAGKDATDRLTMLNLGLKYIYEEEGAGKTSEITISTEELIASRYPAAKHGSNTSHEFSE